MTETTNPQPIEIDDLDQFVKILAAWHASKVKMLNHLIQIPEGTEMVSGTSSVILQGDVLKGFIAGIEVALMELGKLPFTYELEESAVQ